MPRHKKKLLFLTNDYPPNEGGMETCALELSEGFKKFYDVTVITGSPATKKKSIRFCSNGTSSSSVTNKNETSVCFFKIKRINYPRFYPLKFFIIFFTLIYEALISGYDLIYINTWSPFGLPALLISKIFGINYYITCHGLDIIEPIKSKFHKKCMYIVFNSASKLFCVSRYTANILSTTTIIKNPEIIKVVNNGINISKFYPIDKIKSRKKLGIPDKFVILTVSRLTVRKGHKTVIKALSKLTDIPDIIYIVCGRGECGKELHDFTKSMNLSDKVLFTGFVDNKDLLYYYNACDVFVMLSDEFFESGEVEGFGISYIEANACGKPVIALKKAGAVDAVKHNFTGFLIEPKCDIETEFANILRNLYNDKTLLTAIGNSALKYVTENYLWERQIEKYRIEME
ncbi:glycosyltransferase family 4 protein [Candidatus Dependentiae bacterium]|nr:glycosyltransferase family 4 protein [Candidatus Dependentiae bacterium]